MPREPLHNLQAETIDGVLLSLHRVIAWSKQNHSRLGYFAALYHKVTRAVQQGIADGLFADGPRMERLDVLFANRYLAALECYTQEQEPIPQAWRLAFDTAEAWWPVVLQHLFLGMNAHINMDLAIAAAETGPPDQLAALRQDFFTINTLLAGLVQETVEELGTIWPLLRLMERFAREGGQGLTDVGMWLSRGQAWRRAEELALLAPSARAQRIDHLDSSVAALSRLLLPSGRWIRLLLYLIRIGELRFVPTIIEILE